MNFIIFIMLPILLVGGTATYLTSLVCRFARWRHRRPSWFVVPATTIFTALLAAVVIYLGTSLQPGGWGKISPFDPDTMLLILKWPCIVSVIPAFIVVLVYRLEDSRC